MEIIDVRDLCPRERGQISRPIKIARCRRRGASEFSGSGTGTPLSGWRVRFRNIPAQLGEFATTFGVDGYAEYDELLRRDDIDIVQIAAPVAEIPGLAIRAAQAGKHMIIGKPMAMNLDQADEMVAAIERAGVVCLPFQG